jgi:hypothetical protein
MVQLSKRVALGSGKGEPVLRKGNTAWLLQYRLTFSRVLLASTLAIALFNSGAAAQTGDNKKSGSESSTASSPAAKSGTAESSAKQVAPARGTPSPESAKSGTGKKGLESSGKTSGAADKAEAPAADKSNLPFPVISSDNVTSVAGVQSVGSRYFPSAIDIHGSAAGVLLHARRETRYDLLSPLSIWLEEGPLLVSVRTPSEMVLVATKFGDVCVTTGGVALVERGEEDTLRIVNLGTASDTVYLNMHDKLWTGSPWGHTVKVRELNEKDRKGKRQHTYETVESGAVSISPGYELVLAGRVLTLEDVKPPDSIGRRDFRLFEGAHIVVAEISIDNLTQLHDLVKNLNNHGEKASSVFAEIMKQAGLAKSRQGESGFEKNVPAPPKPPEPRRKPPSKVPPPPGKAPAAKPKTQTGAPAMPAPAPAKGSTGAPAAKPDNATLAVPKTPAARTESAPSAPAR